uniref:Major sperm protein n=1 Tax=Meloidogyne incognita TaxID=6306 RepID=A0A914LIR5_MELIC
MSLPPSPTPSLLSVSNNNMLQQQQLLAALETVPGVLTTFPANNLIFNGPFEDSKTYYIKIVNSSSNTIVYHFRRTTRRLRGKPGVGFLSPGESKRIAITCGSFNPATTDTEVDRITFVWWNVPDNITKKFSWSFFNNDGYERRKNIKILYNY